MEQVNIETWRYGDVYDVYDKFSRGLSQDSLKKLSHHVILEEAKTGNQNDCCTICLQVSHVFLEQCHIRSLTPFSCMRRTLKLEKLQGGCRAATTYFTCYVWISGSFYRAPAPSVDGLCEYRGAQHDSFCREHCEL